MAKTKLEICLDNQYVHVFSWLASHAICSFAQAHSEESRKEVTGDVDGCKTEGGELAGQADAGYPA